MTIGSSQQNLQIDQQIEQRAKHTSSIGLWTGIIFVLISVASTISTIQTGLNAYGGIVLTAVIALIGFIAAFSARRGRAGSLLLAARRVSAPPRVM